MFERDALTPIVIDALAALLAHPEGLPLMEAKAAAGAFVASSSGKAAARQASLLSLIQTKSVNLGKKQILFATLTDKGITYLQELGNPANILAQIQTRLSSHFTQLQAAEKTLLECRSILSQLESRARLFADTSSEPARTWQHNITRYLSQRFTEKPAEDCPLPELYQQAKAAEPRLSVGQFHDGIRQLHETSQVHLHPWTGPLHELPEPGMALMIGHALAYYASPAAA